MGSLMRLNRVSCEMHRNATHSENSDRNFVRHRRSVIMTRPNTGFSFVTRIYVEPCFHKQGPHPSSWDPLDGLKSARDKSTRMAGEFRYFVSSFIIKRI